jgi:hypothetical protein
MLMLNYFFGISSHPTDNSVDAQLFLLPELLTQRKVDAQLFLRYQLVPNIEHVRCSTIYTASACTPQRTRFMFNYFLGLSSYPTEKKRIKYSFCQRSYTTKNTVDAQLFPWPQRVLHREHGNSIIMAIEARFSYSKYFRNRKMRWNAY